MNMNLREMYHYNLNSVQGNKLSFSQVQSSRVTIGCLERSCDMNVRNQNLHLRS
jgi:hypothetical protein